MKRHQLALALVLSVLSASTLYAQSQHANQARGFSPNGVYSSHDIDNINLFNGNLVVNLPIGQTYPVGGNLSYQFNLVYNSYHWSQQEVCRDEDVNLDYSFFTVWGVSRTDGDGHTVLSLEPFIGIGTDYNAGPSRAALDGCYTASFPNPAANAGMGWQLTFGKLYYPESDAFHAYVQGTEKDAYVYMAPDGSEHTFYEVLHIGEPRTQNVFYTRDGTYLRMTVHPGGVRKVHFPNGVVHTFEPDGPYGPSVEHRVTDMNDQFGNWVHINYTPTQWTITDSVGRSHVINLQEKTPGFTNVITSVKLDAFAGFEAQYFFDHFLKEIARATPRAPAGQIPGLGNTAIVPFLTSVTLPDGSKYSMPENANGSIPASYDYDGTASSLKAVGVLKRIVLPTGGSIEWKYRGAGGGFEDIHHHYGYPITSSARNYARWSTGVRERILTEGGRRHVWKYLPTPERQPDTGVNGQNCAYQGGEWWTPDCAPRLFTNEVTTPEGDVTKYYFSFYPHPWTDSGRNVYQWHSTEYGLPMNKDVSVPDANNEPLFLSTQVFDAAGYAAGTPKRTTYVRYETDQFPSTNGWGNVSEVNARMVASRTVYHDDSDRFDEVRHSNFDGLGHYRQMDRSSNVRAGGPPQTSSVFINYTKGGQFRVNPQTNRPATGSYFNQIPAGSPWVTGTYSEIVRRDDTSNTKVAEDYVFNAKGQLKRKRIRSAISTAAAHPAARSNDLVIAYEYSSETNGSVEYSSEKDSSVEYPSETISSVPGGNLLFERYFGGDVENNLGTGDLGGLSLTPSNAEYTVSYSYPTCGGSELGVVKEAYLQRKSAHGGGGIKTVDNDIDCATGFVKVSRDVSRNPTTYWYDTSGRITDINSQQGSQTHIGYTPLHQGGPKVNSTVRTNDNATVLDEDEFQYDDLGRLFVEKKRRPGGTSVRYTTYNGMSWKTSVSEWIDECPGQGLPCPDQGKKTEFDLFDPFGRATRVTLPDGKVIRQFYNGVAGVYRKMTVGTHVVTDASQPNGFRVGEQDSEKWERYDEFGRPFQVEEQSGANGGKVTTTHRFNVLGKLSWACTATAGTGQCRSFVYDGRGNLTAESYPERNYTTHGSYDTMGRIGASNDGVNSLIYSYDQAGRPATVEAYAPSFGAWKTFKEFSYHPVGSTAAGAYSGGKLATSTRHNHVRNPYESDFVHDISVTEAYTYAGLDGRVSKRVTSTNIPGTPVFEQSFEYNQFGLLSKQTYPMCMQATCVDSGAQRPFTVSYNYNNEMLTGVGGGPGLGNTTAGTYATSITYNPNMTVGTVAHKNTIVDTEAMDPHNMGRVRQITASRSGAALWDSGQYRYDGSGNVTKIGGDWYLYDKVGRVKAGTALFGLHATKRLKQEYDYDAFGNILTVRKYNNVSLTGATQVGDPFNTGVTSANNRLGLNYDAAGNVLGFVGQPAVYTLDAANMIVTAPGLTYLYGPNDERFWTIDTKLNTANEDNVETFTLRGLGNEVLREYKVVGGNAQGNWMWEKDYIYRGSKLLAAETRSGVRHYHVDHLGSPRLITDGGGNEVQRMQFLPFGENSGFYSTGESWSLNSTPFTETRLRFTGHEKDSDPYGLVYMHARYYLESAGKFMSVDPGRDIDFAQPQSWNLYAYVRNNPINATDPDGRWAAVVGTLAQQMEQERLRNREMTQRYAEARAQANGIDMGYSCFRCHMENEARYQEAISNAPEFSAKDVTPDGVDLVQEIAAGGGGAAVEPGIRKRLGKQALKEVAKKAPAGAAGGSAAGPAGFLAGVAVDLVLQVVAKAVWSGPNASAYREANSDRLKQRDYCMKMCFNSRSQQPWKPDPSIPLPPR